MNERKLSESNRIIVCSATVRGIRKLIPRRLRTWIDVIVKTPSHTFAVAESAIPLDPEFPLGYWYCAGDFCDIHEPGVYQALVTAKYEKCYCLVASDIKDGDPDRPKRVIDGRYNYQYVCHNITNRILFASPSNITLLDLDIPIGGYEATVKSSLGVYGQSIPDWSQRLRGCGYINLDSYDVRYKKKPISRAEEIYRIHLRATRGDPKKAKKVTNALRSIDLGFLAKTIRIQEEIEHYLDNPSQYEQPSTIDDMYNRRMGNAAIKLLDDTMHAVGYELAKRIYPGCIFSEDGRRTKATHPIN